ncbi:MAG: Ig-like domain-containing protein [Oscillospiraceae bacterium]|nr:Ig-like domain-containing protein [Oscillospiraceae bacterium]
MKKKIKALLFLLAFCLLLTGCRKEAEEKSEEPTALPEATVEASVATAVPVVTEVPATPEPTKEPVKAEILYEGEEATSLSFQTSTVFQLTGTASDGSTGGIWTSSDASAASVDENGVVTCWKAGQPKITYSLGDASATCSLNITEPTVQICFGGVEKTDISLSSLWGYTIQLEAKVNPAGSEVSWSSDNPSVVSVSETGLVTGLSRGTANVSCKCGTAKANCIIRIIDDPPTYLAAQADPADTTPRIVITYAGVPVNNDITIIVGQAVDMGYTLYNIDPAANVTWSVEDYGFASVDANGVIVGLKTTWGIAANRNYTRLVVTCGEYQGSCYVFIKDNKT